MDDRSKEYLEAYLNSLAPEASQKYNSFSSDYFCADEINANVCAELILKGHKTASCSMEYWYSHENEPKPKIGHLQVVTNWSGEPVCIIEITSVSTCKYRDVTAAFAEAEGEGDKTLKWWRKAHWEFFSLECKEQGIEPKQDMPLVLEHFKVVC